MKKSEQEIAVAGMGTVIPVGVFLPQQTRFDEILNSPADGFGRDAQVTGNPFHAGPDLVLSVFAVIEIHVDELRPLGKLVISIQLFKIWHRIHRKRSIIAQ